MQGEIKCNICGCDSYEVLYRSGNAAQEEDRYLITAARPSVPKEIIKCADCGLIYARPFLSPEKLNSFYIKMSDEEYKNEEYGRRISAKKILNKLKKNSERGRILDIGCATGFLLDEARREGWEAYGVELSKWCVDHAKNNLGLNVFCGLLKDACFEDDFFDAAVLNDVIEHLPDPKDTLTEIRRILKKGGIICINTPDIDSLLSKLLKARWWGINQAHLFYFTKKTLSKMLKSIGFSQLKFTGHPRTFSLKYWVFRFRNYNEHIYNMLKFFVCHTPLGNLPLTINTADQIEVYAKNQRS